MKKVIRILFVLILALLFVFSCKPNFNKAEESSDEAFLKLTANFIETLDNLEMTLDSITQKLKENNAEIKSLKERVEQLEKR